MLEDLEYTAIREYCLNTSKKPKKKQVEPEQASVYSKLKNRKRSANHRV